jgi:hypothetical protein
VGSFQGHTQLGDFRRIAVVGVDDVDATGIAHPVEQVVLHPIIHSDQAGVPVQTGEHRYALHLVRVLGFEADQSLVVGEPDDAETALIVIDTLALGQCRGGHDDECAQHRRADFPGISPASPDASHSRSLR